MNDLKIKKGSIIIYRLFDVAFEIDLSLVESKIQKGVKRLTLSKIPYMKAIEFTNPPVSIGLTSFKKDILTRHFRTKVLAKVYDFGVISLSMEIPIAENMSFHELEIIAKELDADESVEDVAKNYIAQLINSLEDALKEPYLKEEFIEDYTIFFIEKVIPHLNADELLNIYDPSRLLLYETRDISEDIKRDTLKNHFSYYPDDLVIVHLDNAFIIDPSGNADINDILEFANAQILELRYYDNVLDRELERIYSGLSNRGGISIFKLREYEQFARNITETVTDLSEVTGRVHNALKVTEDVYYARIYRSVMVLLRSDDWMASIKEKLNVITNTHRMIYDEITTKRGHLLELGIFLLIVIEIVLLLIIEW